MVLPDATALRHAMVLPAATALRHETRLRHETGLPVANDHLVVTVVPVATTEGAVRTATDARVPPTALGRAAVPRRPDVPSAVVPIVRRATAPVVVRVAATTSDRSGATGPGVPRSSPPIATPLWRR
jgi:hypothetical protein